MKNIHSDPFSPFTIKNFTFKNRIGVAPMTRMSAGNDSIPRKDVLDFLTRRAKNDVALIYTEAIVTDYESAQGYPGQSRITNQQQIDSWKIVTDSIRQHGAVSIMQLFHCGRMAYDGINPANRVIGPSEIAPQQINPMTEKQYPVPSAMSQFDIDHVIQGFVESVRGAVAAGFDGVEIHGAHGYLINQFLSSYSNKRQDRYGGSVENRFRFASEVIQAVKTVLPPDKLLFFRISNWGIADMDVSLFSDKHEWQEMITLLSQEPIDAISVSTYNFQDNAFLSGATMSQLTRQVSNLPIIICGKIYDRKTAELALQHADMILSGKSSLLDPDFVAHIKSGKELNPYSAQDANIAYTSEPLP